MCVLRWDVCLTWGCCTAVSFWSRPLLPCDAVWTEACAKPSSLTWMHGQSEGRQRKKMKKWLNIEENKRITSCICGNRPHQLNVVENSRNFLNSLHNLLRCISIFNFTWGLLIQSHLPAHSWVLNLQTDRDVYTQTLILYLRCFLHLPFPVDAGYSAETPSLLRLCLSVTFKSTKSQQNWYYSVNTISQSMG